MSMPTTGSDTVKLLAFTAVSPTYIISLICRDAGTRLKQLYRILCRTVSVTNEDRKSASIHV